MVYLKLKYWILSQPYLIQKSIYALNALTPVSDQDRISSYNINQIRDDNRVKYEFGDNEMIQY